MPTRYESKQHRPLRKPSDASGREFENLSLLVHRHAYRASDGIFYGRGHRQHGIDIRLTVCGQTIVIQCKQVERMSYSTFGDDLSSALARWAPRHPTSPPLLFILATTAKNLDTSDIDDKIKAELALLPEGVRERVSVEIHDWDWFEHTVRSSVELAEYLLEPDESYREYRSHELQKSVKLVAQHVAERRLSSAREAWSQYCAGRPEAEPLQPALLPMNAYAPLLDLYLAAGDFEEAKKILDGALGRQPFNARFRLAYLRSVRVVNAIPKISRTLQFGKKQPGTLDAEIDNFADELLEALGGLDEQLTLALWVVTYTTKAAIAATALMRARSLLNQAWPAEIPCIATPLHHELSDYGPRPVPCFWPGSPSPQAGLANALTTAYVYIRQLHTYRFGRDATLAAEQPLGEWPDSINPVSYRRPGKYFAELSSEGYKQLNRALPLFTREAGGACFAWWQSVHFVHNSVPQLPLWGAVCSSNILLTDCDRGHIEQRLSLMPLFTSNLSLERLLQVQQLAKIECDLAPEKIQAIDWLLDHSLRHDGGQTEGTHRLYALPAYADLTGPRRNPELAAAIALAAASSRPYFCTFGPEIQATGDTVNILAYWNPGP
ncbi:hypothetical protein [Duganella sp. HH105]|uniref:hypothetical protein n=1 Tax=Duganella sp. HH105 TaxID=1781067 RepID=UPI000892CA5E|nr:hypothetical protein [Duganella sp. HH105]OEZ63362.1 hypothetical protein DUGA6_11590 [Duganella sp. HH105]